MGGWPFPVGEVLFVLAKAWLLLLPLVSRRFVDLEPLSFSPARRGGFVVAGVSGLVISAIIVAAYFGFGARVIDPEGVRTMAAENGIGTISAYFAAAAGWILVNSVLEEYVYRWFIFRQFEALVAGPVAAVASALCFTLHHVIAMRAQFDWTITAIASFGVFVGGLVWSWMYLKYRSVWPGYLSHALVDVAVFAIGYFLIFG